MGTDIGLPEQRTGRSVEEGVDRTHLAGAEHDLLLRAVDVRQARIGAIWRSWSKRSCGRTCVNQSMAPVVRSRAIRLFVARFGPGRLDPLGHSAYPGERSRVRDRPANHARRGVDTWLLCPAAATGVHPRVAPDVGRVDRADVPDDSAGLLVEAVDVPLTSAGGVEEVARAWTDEV